MIQSRFLRLLSVGIILGGLSQVGGQELQIGIIDLYGLTQVTPGQIREALTFREGDSISIAGDDLPAMFSESERRLSNLTGVVRAHTNVVCCDNGRAIVYVGIEERGAPTMRFRVEPVGKARLAADVVDAGNEFSKALMLVFQGGNTKEDGSQGHAFSADPRMRAIQERLTDPSEGVRNNAMRALLVFAEMVPDPARLMPRIPHEPFIALLNSPVWTDRNKATGALMALSERREPALLTSLRKQALAPLIEMARWKSDGHSRAAFVLLARVADYSDDAIERAWDARDRELVISAALRRQ